MTINFYQTWSSTVNSYVTLANQRDQPLKYESSLKLAKFSIERDHSWEVTYLGIDQGKPRLHEFGANAAGVGKGVVVGQAPS